MVLPAARNQHAAGGFARGEGELRRTIAAVDWVLLVLAPLEGPTALARAWCLPEVFVGAQSGIPLDVAMPRAQRGPFRATLAGSFGSLAAAISPWLTLADARASRPEDRAGILRAVREGVGVRARHSAVRAVLRDRLAQTGRRALDKRPADLALASALGRLLQAQGRLG